MKRQRLHINSGQQEIFQVNDIMKSMHPGTWQVHQILCETSAYAAMDITHCPGDQSPWCHTLRLMKSITLVRLSWYQVGVHLYPSFSPATTYTKHLLHQNPHLASKVLLFWSSRGIFSVISQRYSPLNSTRPFTPS